MIKVHPRRAPNGFREHVLEPGLNWLSSNEHRDPKRPEDYWNQWPPCPEKLAKSFGHRCGYTACWTPVGQVEHFVSWKRCKQIQQRRLAYEWGNYRWILPQLNGRKSTKELLDPFEVEDDWFEVNIFTLHLRLTKKVPADMRIKAELTLKTLKLDRGPLVVAIRREALERYRGGTPLAEIERYSPLMARALRRLLQTELSTLPGHERRLRRRLEHDHAAARSQ